jgi:hypothetical protein
MAAGADKKHLTCRVAGQHGFGHGNPRKKMPPRAAAAHHQSDLPVAHKIDGLYRQIGCFPEPVLGGHLDLRQGFLVAGGTEPVGKILSVLILDWNPLPFMFIFFATAAYFFHFSLDFSFV